MHTSMWLPLYHWSWDPQCLAKQNQLLFLLFVFRRSGDLGYTWCHKDMAEIYRGDRWMPVLQAGIHRQVYTGRCTQAGRHKIDHSASKMAYTRNQFDISGCLCLFAMTLWKCHFVGCVYLVLKNPSVTWHSHAHSFYEQVEELKHF